MTQPNYVPVTTADQVRPVDRLRVPRIWMATRPADLRGADHPRGPMLGSPGPDQGYALLLARGFVERLELASGESSEDAVAGCVAVAMMRAAVLGRAPVIYDCEHAFTLWGFLGGAPDDLVAFRGPLFRSAAHHYEAQRAICDLVPEATLRMSPEEVAAGLVGWRELINSG